MWLLLVIFVGAAKIVFTYAGAIAHTVASAGAVISYPVAVSIAVAIPMAVPLTAALAITIAIAEDIYVVGHIPAVLPIKCGELTIGQPFKTPSKGVEG